MWAFGVLFYYMLNMSYPFGTYFFIQKSILTGLLMPSTRNFASRLRNLATGSQLPIVAGKILITALMKSKISLGKYLEMIKKKESIFLKFVSIQFSLDGFQSRRNNLEFFTKPNSKVHFQVKENFKTDLRIKQV